MTDRKPRRWQPRYGKPDLGGFIHHRGLAEAVERGVRESGAVPVDPPTVAVSPGPMPNGKWSRDIGSGDGVRKVSEAARAGGLSLKAVGATGAGR
ncbi:MAG: hypothetical protein ACOCYW_08240 [Roseicyclus sp.]